MSVVPFRYLAHLVTVPVLADGRSARFVVDTGIGVTLVSESLAARAGCRPDGSAYTGRRMSGHPVTLPLGSLSSLRVGDHGAEDVTVGIFDMSDMAGLEGIDGFLGLDYFRSVPVTFDYPAGVVVLEEVSSLAQRARAGVSAGVRVEHDQCSTSVFLPLEVPGAGSLTVEVDTGSDVLILDEARAQEVGVDLAGPGTRRVEGRDETGQAFTRYFAKIPGAISVAGAPAIGQADPEVMFQKIIYDGLLGNAFLRNFAVTYDLPGTRMIFGGANGL
jgi:Aspartyl protease